MIKGPSILNPPPFYFILTFHPSYLLLPCLFHASSMSLTFVFNAIIETLVIRQPVFLVKLINPPASIDEFLLPRKKGVALRAYLNAQLGFR